MKKLRLVFPGLAGRHGLKFLGDSYDNRVEINDTKHNQRPAPFGGMLPDGVSLAFAAFALAHSGCGEEASELRLDERSLIGWCRRCDESRIFVVGRADHRGQPRPNLVSEGGSVS